MKPSEVPTVKTKRSRVILVVGFGDAFVRRCREAAVNTGATIKGVEAGDEAARALQGLPLAMVKRRDTIRTSLLATVAREIGVGLIAVPGEDVTDARLKEFIEGALAAAQARARSR